MATHDELLDLERAFWGAAGNGAVYRDNFADDGVCVFPMGVFDKETTMAAVDAAEPWVEVLLDDVKTIPLAGDATSVIYRATARRRSDGEPYKAHIASTYVRRGGTWLLTVHQQTPTM